MAIRTQRTRIREPFPPPRTPGIYKSIAYSFVALTMIIVFAALWLSSVRATVWISAARESTEINTDVAIAQQPANGELAGRVVQGVFEEVKEFTVSEGEARETEGTATGKVRIFNTFSNSQPLIATTRLLTSDGRLYRISEGVTVPPGGTVDVEAYADEDGSKYDFTEKTNFSIPGLSESMQKFIHAESITPFKGGRMLVRVLTQEDVAKAEEELREIILEGAKKSLRADASDPRFTEATYLVDLVEKNTSARYGEEVDSFLMSLKLNVTGVFYPKMDLDALVKQKVADRIPEGKALVSDYPAKMQFEVSNVDVPRERATLDVKAEVLTKATDADDIVDKEEILGLPIDEAEHALEEMKGVDEAEVNVRPNWVRRLPTLEDHITVKIR